jgi:hypothetical protein
MSSDVNQSLTYFDFLSLVPADAPLLEIGPYAKPSFLKSTHNVFYADILTAEQIRAECQSHGYNPEFTPEAIDIQIDLFGTPSIKTDLRFSTVFSSHNIEHQPNLIRHLNEVSALTIPNGKFFLAIPDKRYCFDHWRNASSIADIIAAYIDNRVKHTSTTVLNGEIVRAHNVERAHWLGNHGDYPVNSISDHLLESIKHGIDKAIKNRTEYIDTHAWQFTPASFLLNIQILKRLNLQPWTITHIWNTRPGSNEFYAVLQNG